jgi:transposase-like protein
MRADDQSASSVAVVGGLVTTDDVSNVVADGHASASHPFPNSVCRKHEGAGGEATSEPIRFFTDAAKSVDSFHHLSCGVTAGHHKILCPLLLWILAKAGLARVLWTRLSGIPAPLALEGAISKRYPPEFRRRVLALLKIGKSVSGIATDLEVSSQTIHNWRRQEQIDSGLRPGVSKSTHAQLIAARRQIAQLEPELAVTRPAAELLREAEVPRKRVEQALVGPARHAGGRSPGRPQLLGRRARRPRGHC